MTDERRLFLRHTVATLAYRGGKALRDAPESFVAYRAGEGSRTPAQILAHIGDLLEWALSIARGKQAWHDSAPSSWELEKERFFQSLRAFDDFLASELPVAAPLDKLFQGPIADALTHVGQLTMLRRLAGAPVRGENYYVARIETGRVGPEQAAPVREFD